MKGKKKWVKEIHSVVSEQLVRAKKSVPLYGLGREWGFGRLVASLFVYRIVDKHLE